MHFHQPSNKNSSVSSAPSSSESPAPASGLPGADSSNTLTSVDDEKPKGRSWNGYACPGCRTVFRVAADFAGGDVACPACKETLRLPKTPEEVPQQTILPEKPAAPPAPVAPVIPSQPAIPALHTPAAKPSMWRAMLATSDGRLKLSLALLVPLALIMAALALFQPDETATDNTTGKQEPTVQPAPATPEKPTPPPPPVAVSEMPDSPPPPSLPAPEDTPPAEVAAVEPAPATPVVEVPTQKAEPDPPIPAPAPEPVAAVIDPEHGLVEAIPVELAPEPEKPAPPPAAPLEPTPAPAPAAAPSELVHNVVRGDTLSGIARKYQVGMDVIKQANSMRGDTVMLGQKLKIPGGTAPAAEPEAPKVVKTPAPTPQAPRSHTVVRGDTLERISRKYGVTPQQVMQANGMKNDIVRLGRKLVIPSP